MEYFLFAVFVPVWLLVMYVVVRYAIPGEPSGVNRIGMALVVLGVNLGLVGFLGYQGYLLLSKSALLVESSGVAERLYLAQQALALAALACVVVGGWMRIRSIIRERNS